MGKKNTKSVYFSYCGLLENIKKGLDLPINEADYPHFIEGQSWVLVEGCEDIFEFQEIIKNPKTRKKLKFIPVENPKEPTYY